jgi:hypothetical protein
LYSWYESFEGTDIGVTGNTGRDFLLRPPYGSKRWVVFVDFLETFPDLLLEAGVGKIGTGSRDGSLEGLSTVGNSTYTLGMFGVVGAGFGDMISEDESLSSSSGSAERRNGPRNF